MRHQDFVGLSSYVPQWPLNSKDTLFSTVWLFNKGTQKEKGQKGTTGEPSEILTNFFEGFLRLYGSKIGVSGAGGQDLTPSLGSCERLISVTTFKTPYYPR